MDRTWLPWAQLAEQTPLRRAAEPEQGRRNKQLRRRAGAGDRSYDTPPPAWSPPTRAASAATSLRPDLARRAGAVDRRCLKDTVARVLPYWNRSHHAPTIRSGKRVLIAAHGNSIRALVKLPGRHLRPRHRGARHPQRHPAGVQAGRPELKPCAATTWATPRCAAKACRRH